MISYWERVEVIIRRISATPRTKKSGDVLRATSNLMLAVIEECDDGRKEKLGSALMTIYDGVSQTFDDTDQGTSWHDLGLHLNKFR